MHIIAKRALVDFYSVHKDAETPLRIWFTICDKTTFDNFSHLRRSLPGVDKVGKFTVFDIGGNKYRLVAVIHYNRRKIYVRHVLTHEEYDLEQWKRE